MTTPNTRENETRERRSTRRPRLDAWEGSTSYRVTVDLPGVDSENLAVKLDGDVLTLRGERHHSDGSDSITVRYERTLRLPDRSDLEEIEARLVDGVLTLDLAKRSDALVRDIPIATS